jgi:hypothetical protein
MPAQPSIAQTRSGMLTAHREHLLVASLSGGKPASTQNVLVGVDDLDGGATFVRVHADDHAAHGFSSLCRGSDQRGRQRYCELGRPRLSQSSPR